MLSLDARLIDNALEAIQRTQEESGSEEDLVPQLASDPSALHRSNFLYLCPNPEIYDAVRRFPFDEEYARKEEQHFQQMCELVQDWNERHFCCRVPLGDCKMPAVETLRRLWRMQQEGQNASRKDVRQTTVHGGRSGITKSRRKERYKGPATRTRSKVKPSSRSNQRHQLR